MLWVRVPLLLPYTNTLHAQRVDMVVLLAIQQYNAVVVCFYMVKRSTGCKRSPGGQVIVGAKGVRFPDADAICKHISNVQTVS